MINIIKDEITYVRLDYQIFRVKKDFFIEVELKYINPIIKYRLNVGNDSVIDEECLIVSILDEYLDLPLNKSIKDPKDAFIHLGMIIDICNVSIDEHLGVTDI